MKIYFAGSIRGGRSDQEIYFSIIRELKKYGQVLTEHVGEKNIEEEEKERGNTDTEIFERDMSWVKEADVVVAEVTTPSLGVGYEIGQAQSMNKPIICLYRKTEGKKLSAMLSGNSHISVFEYSSVEEAEKIIKNELSGLL